MVYKFDPVYVNGSVFTHDNWCTSGDTLDYKCANKPIPAAFFRKSLTVEKAVPLPDMFHASSGIIVFSARARLLMEEIAPGG